MSENMLQSTAHAVVLSPVDDQVYHALRQEIIEGSLKPDSVLRLRDLAERFQVSTTPVREALERLKSDGLCKQIPHRGTRVVELSRAEFEDIYAVRIGLESQAVRLGLERIDDEGIALVRKNWSEAFALWAEGREPTLDEYLPMMNRVYMPCIEATDMPRLVRLILDYRRFAERYLRVALTELEVLRDDVMQQENFVLACENRDPDEAERATRAMLVWTVDHLRGRLSS